MNRELQYLLQSWLQSVMNLAVNLILVAFLSVYAESAILEPVESRCRSLPYLKLRRTAERETISEIAELAEGVPGSRACGHGGSTYDSAYRSLLCAAGVTSTPEKNATFYEAVGDISKSMYKACYGSDRIGIGDFAAIKAKYEMAYKKKNITELRKAYGSLVCLIKKVSTRAKRTPTVAPGTPNAAIRNFYCTIQNANHIGRLFFDPMYGGKYSVAFVLDDTGSMGPHIEIAKCLVRSFLASSLNGPEKYILGTFNDPGNNYICWISIDSSNYTVLSQSYFTYYTVMCLNFTHICLQRTTHGSTVPKNMTALTSPK